MEDRVEDGDALGVAQVAHWIVAVVDAPDEACAPVAQRQQRGRSLARETLVGDAGRMRRASLASATNSAMPTHAVWP